MVASNSSGNPQVWQYSGSGSNWTALTGTNTIIPTPNHGLATTIATDCNNNVAHGTTSLFMMAEDSNFANFIWKYNGSGTSWSQITGSNTGVVDMAFVDNTLYMLARNGGNYQIWAYQGSGTNWSDVTPGNWQVQQMWVAGDTLVVQAQMDLSRTAEPRSGSATVASRTRGISPRARAKRSGLGMNQSALGST